MPKNDYKAIKREWKGYMLHLFKRAKAEGWTQEQTASAIASTIADAQRHADNDGWETPIQTELI